MTRTALINAIVAYAEQSRLWGATKDWVDEKKTAERWNAVYDLVCTYFDAPWYKRLWMAWRKGR
jgi:hypothetical protein